MKMKQQRNVNEGVKTDIERNKHLNFRKQTKQKDENDYKPISARKGKSNNRKNVTLGSYRVYSKFLSSRLKTRLGSAGPSV